jgi:hypothetical protein
MNPQIYKDIFAALKQALDYERRIGPQRIRIYAEAVGDSKPKPRFWLCLQHPSTGRGEGEPEFTVAGQRYLDRDGEWREPHGAKARRNFSSLAAARKFADTLL